MKTRSGFFGVYPMVYALFDERGNLAREPMRRQIRSMLRHDVHGIGLLGLASEVNKLATPEPRTLMEWVAEARKRPGATPNRWASSEARRRWGQCSGKS
jgi:dihydrodipicolinate synthase/N-acetylneuraminate lyase